MTEPIKNEFVIEMCKAFLSADIPINKIDNPTFRQFMEKYTKKIVPCQSSLRRSIPNVYDEVIANIRNEIGDRPIWLSIDETTDSTARYVANVVVGALNKDGPSKPHLLMSRELEVTNNSTITQLVLDALIFLWPGQKNQEIGGKFVVLLTDAAADMVKAGKNLKNTYPDLMHVTCLAHGLNRVAETVKSLFPIANRAMAAVKAVFKKAPSRILKYKEMLPNLALPPEPVLTRWGTWLNAADFYCTNYDSIKQVIEALEGTDAVAIQTAQTLFEMRTLKDELACLSANFTFIAKSIVSLEDRNLTLWDSVAIVENVRKKIGSCKSTINKSVKTKMDTVLGKNPDYATLVEISSVLQGKSSGTGTLSFTLQPEVLASLKYCPLTSVEVERSFSMQKGILTDRRQKFLMENLEKVVVCHYELSIGSEIHVSIP